LGIKNKKFKIGDLVRINDNTHWGGSNLERDGIVTAPGPYYESYIVLFTGDGEERQFHGSFMKLLSRVEK